MGRRILGRRVRGVAVRPRVRSVYHSLGRSLGRSLALALALAPALPLALAPGDARAQPAPPREVSLTRGPASDLYIRKRPVTPDAPILSGELKTLLASTEKRRDDKRLEAIGMLRGYLQSKPSGEARAEGMFKLAELLWEESRRLYLIAMEDFSRAMEKCAAKKNCTPPQEPRIDLKEAEALYVELHARHPAVRRMDLVTYLIGFAA